MKRFIIAAAALAALVLPAQAQFVQDVGPNPTSATGTFNHAVFGTTFADFITFQLSGSAPQYIAFATAENTFVQATDRISNFTGQLFEQVGAPGGGDDIPVNLPVFAVGCPTNPTGCQVLSGSAILPTGAYFLELTGTGGGTSGYSGSVTTLAVPAPLAGMGALPLLTLLGVLGWRWRRQEEA